MKESYFSHDGFPVHPPEDPMTLRMLDSSRGEVYVRQLSEEVVRTGTFLIQRCRDVFQLVPDVPQIDHFERKAVDLGKKVIDFLVIEKDQPDYITSERESFARSRSGYP